MLDMDLLYVTYRQQELWHEAAAQALTAHVHAARPRWWARVLDTLATRVCPSMASRAPYMFGAASVAQPRQERTAW
jgi:hypothetical protein